MDNKEEAEKLAFNVDLYKQALYQLKFLKAVENVPELKRSDILERAVYRYERFWLPLAADHPDACLVAPLDIEWVWHCHMLSPVAYERDCETIVGKTINHSLHSQASFAKEQSISQEYWLQKYGDKAEPFILDYSSATDGNDVVQYNSKLTHDIIAAASRQESFYYQVSLPHYEDKNFLEHSILRYKQFLFIKTRVEQDFLVPCYDIDLIWHTHLLNPVAYKEDMVRIFGELFNHDDSVNDRSKDSKLDKAGKETDENWSTFYNEGFSLSGSMYRGKPPQGRLHGNDFHLDVNFEKEYASVKKTCTISLDRLTLTLPSEELNRYRGIKLTGTICQKILAVKAFLSIERRVTLSSQPSVCIELNNVFHEKFDTELADNIRFELHGQTSVLCCKSESILGSGTLNIVPIINQMQFAESDGPIKERITLGDDISLDIEGRFWNLQFKQHKEKIKQLLHKKIINLDLEIGQYRTVLIPDDIQQLFGPIALERRPESASNICQTATHRYTNALSGDISPLEVTIFHSQHLHMSVIQVIHNKKMAAIAHLIASDQLPLPTHVISKKNGVTLNPRQGERAVLIKNNEGDWGIVIGHWEGGRIVYRSPGNLGTKFYKFSSGKVIQYHLYKQSIEGFDVSRHSGNIQLNTTKDEIAEHIALEFAVSLLIVLCVPRPEGYQDGQNVELRGNLVKGENKASVANTDSMSLIVASGLQANAPTNYYINKTFGIMTCNMYGGKVTKCDDWAELPGKGSEDPNSNGCGCGGGYPMDRDKLVDSSGGSDKADHSKSHKKEKYSKPNKAKYSKAHKAKYSQPLRANYSQPLRVNYSKPHVPASTYRAHAGTETKSGTGDSSSFAVDHLHISVLDYDSGGGGFDSGGGCDTSSSFD